MILPKISVVIRRWLLYNSYIGRLRPPGPPEREQKEASAMGMTDKQFNSYVRFILSALKDMLEETDEQKKAAKAKELMENLQTSLED